MKPVLVVFLVLNLFAAAITSHAYTEWSIRTRNELYFFLLRRPRNRERADNADEIAEGVVRWLRPLGFVLANLLAGLIAFQELRSR